MAREADIALAHRLADAAGAAIRPLFRSAYSYEAKADASPVTEADRAAEGAMRRLLDAEAPRDGLVLCAQRCNVASYCIHRFEMQLRSVYGRGCPTTVGILLLPTVGQLLHGNGQFAPCPGDCLLGRGLSRAEPLLHQRRRSR